MDCVLLIVRESRAPSPRQITAAEPSAARRGAPQAHCVGVKPEHPFSSSFWKAAAKSEKNLALSLAYCFVYLRNFLSVTKSKSEGSIMSFFDGSSYWKGPSQARGVHSTFNNRE